MTKIYAIETRKTGTDHWYTILAGPRTPRYGTGGVIGYANAALSFETKEEAQAYMEEHCPTIMKPGSSRLRSLPSHITG